MTRRLSGVNCPNATMKLSEPIVPGLQFAYCTRCDIVEGFPCGKPKDKPQSYFMYGIVVDEDR